MVPGENAAEDGGMTHLMICRGNHGWKLEGQDTETERDAASVTMSLRSSIERKRAVPPDGTALLRRRRHLVM